MEGLDAGQVKAWSDAVGPTVMAFFGISIVVGLLIIPLLRRDKKEGGNAGADLSLYDRVSRMETKMELIWDRYKRGDE